MSNPGYCMSLDQNRAKLVAALPSDRVALLLAGGDGMRLQELTREIAGAPIPKQYCRLLQGSSLLEVTLRRAQLFSGRERINIVVNQNHLGLAAEQLRAFPQQNIFVQPLNRDTGPGMLFALLRIEQTHPDAIIGVFPTDHYVDDDRAFVAHILRASNTIARLPDKIAILGIAPDRPETGYGYIIPSAPTRIAEKTYHVQAFVEKPNLPTAQSIIGRGGLWNTFVMVFRLARMMELLCQFVPDEFRTLCELRESPGKAAALYQTLSSWNLSTALLARIPQHLILFEVADVSWSDWGTRESVERTYHALNLVPSWNQPGVISSQIHP